MYKALLSLILAAVCFTTFATTRTITAASSPFKFSPDTLTISLGDSVKFDLASNHNAREVSETTWMANGTAALSGGFQLGFGGGLVTPEHLTTGTHWYVCTPHASSCMKAVIIVENTTGIEKVAHPGFTLANLANSGRITLTMNDFQPGNSAYLEIYNIRGQRVFQTRISEVTTEINLGLVKPGMYLVTVFYHEAILSRKVFVNP